MLFGNSRTSSVIDGGSENIVDFCDQYLTAERLTKHLESADPMSRKDLCRYLDVGESTLTGWLKEDRIPRTAKHAIVLRLLLPHLRPLKEEPTDPRLVEIDDGYQICEFHRSDDGGITGRVIAQGIPDIHRGRLLVAGIKLDSLRERGLRLLKKHGGGTDFFEVYFSDKNVEWTPEESRLKADSEQLDTDIQALLAAPDRFGILEVTDLLRRAAASLAAAAKTCFNSGLNQEAADFFMPGLEIRSFMDSASDYLGTRAGDASEATQTPEAGS